MEPKAKKKIFHDIVANDLRSLLRLVCEEVFKMAKKMSIYDFVYGDCWMAKGSGLLVTVWLKTKGNPCSICGEEKTKCAFYKELVSKKIIDKTEHLP